ncbi:MAG: peptidoglycan DD-metalloendopeptidase family protein [Nitrospiraceae bacterium]|nr:peptidoglycan DD-metalloendopeptidase family protein [Nitrospiraceae bacterium]
MSEPVTAIYFDPSRRVSRATPPSRPVSASRLFGRALRSAGESEHLAKSEPAPLTHIVQRGENLCRVSEKALRSAGANPTKREVYLAAQKVARANGLRDANFILAGQTLDLSVLRLEENLPQAVGGPAPKAAAVSTTSSTRAAALLQRLSALAARASQPSQAAKSSEVSAWIVDGPTRVTSGYGMRNDPFSNRRQRHDGIDLAAAMGTNVYPAMAGTVTFSGWRSGYGRTVIVKHTNGLETRYAHNAKNYVRAGDLVTARTRIADVGSSGRSTGPHLHFEARRNGRPIDPEPYLSRPPIQLAQAR